MGIFITQGNYTEQAMMGMIDNPEDRASPVAGLMESVGAKLLQLYFSRDWRRQRSGAAAGSARPRHSG